MWASRAQHMTGQKDNRSDEQQIRKTTGQKHGRIMWASRAHGMTYDRTEEQQDRKTTDQTYRTYVVTDR